MEKRNKNYIIPLVPIPWRRSPDGQKKTFFDNRARDRVSFGLYLRQQHDDDHFFHAPIDVDITFYMPIPKSKPQSPSSLYHSGHPKLEALIQLLFEYFNSIILEDHRIISSIKAKKIYDKKPRTEFTITEV